MDTNKFLETVLGSTGCYCVFASRLTDTHRVQKFFASVEDVATAAEILDSDGYDAYFALATFQTPGSRKADNAVEMRALFLDLDCGESKAYPTQADAVSDLRKFCKELSLPRPTLINSGRGIHVYWPLTAAVPCAAWVPVAEKLKQVCRDYGLKSDPAVTADIARVLRVPGTHNHKDSPPKEVGLISEMSEPVEFDAFSALLVPKEPMAMPAPLQESAQYESQGSDALMDALIGSVTSRFKTIMLKTVDGKGCPQLLEVFTNQGNIEEPLWRAGLSIAKFCVDGAKSIHRISDKHPEYDPKATEEKAANIKGPYLCVRFDEFRPGICPQCEHWGKLKSPITLGKEVQEAEEEDNVVQALPLGIPAAKELTYVIPKYPKPYFRGKNGGVYIKQRKEGAAPDEPPEDHLIYFNDLYVVRRLHDQEYGEAIVMRLHLPKDGVREFTLPLSIVGAADELRKQLAMQGVAVIDVAALRKYIVRWVNELQLTTTATSARRQFGWSDDVGTSFILGNMEIFKDRIEMNAPSVPTAQMFSIFTQKGTLEGWKETMRFFNRPGFEMHQFMIGLSFGSVLMEFQAINAAAFHTYSPESGLGKTTAMLAGASVWGVPDEVMLKQNDTLNTRMNRAEVYRSVVAYLDETTNAKPQELSDFSYQLTHGQQRNRMSSRSNVERVRGRPWKMLFGSTGNTSMIERISLYKTMPKAEAMRILEYHATQVLFKTKEETDILFAAIKQNYGHAGIVFLQYVMNNLADCIALAEQVQREIDAAAGLVAEHRFWSALTSRDIAGLIIAKRAGLIDWDIAAITKWIVAHLRASKGMVNEMIVGVESSLANYLAENYNNILRIKSTDDARKVPPGVELFTNPAGSPRVSIVARYEYDVKRMYLLPKPLKEWCSKQQIHYNGMIEELRKGRTAAKREKMRLSRGTHMNLPPADVIVLNCEGFMDEETEAVIAATAALGMAEAQRQPESGD